MSSLTVIIATKNEAHNIEACINSVKFADEIIVLDSGSTDGTEKLAYAAGAKVIATDWPGYGPQQARGIKMASCEWVLSLDADERIGEKLRNEILNAINNPIADGYRLPRLSSLCGHFIYHSGWRPDFTLRLVKQNKAGFTDHFLHARMTVEGKKSDLKESIIHYSYRSFDDLLEKLNRYASGNAKDLYARGEKGSLTKAITHAIWAFIRTWIIRAGFLDGKYGLILAIYNAESTYYKYLKLIELQEKSN